jgi:hypothetical protein
MTTTKEEIKIFSGFGVLIDIKTDNNFLIIKETLSRIGIADKKTNKLYPSCYILHKKDRNGKSIYSILHFKELMCLDGGENRLTDVDIKRRNCITNLLEKWGLVDILDNDVINVLDTYENLDFIYVLPHNEKHNWTIHDKYRIGKF